MSAILTIPPALEPLSLPEVKAHLKVDTILDDDLLTRLILTARQQVESLIDKVLISQSWKIYLDNWPADGEIKLPVCPVMQVDDLRTYSADDIAAVVDPSHYYVDLAATPQRLVLRGSRTWLKPGRSVNGIEIEVTAGYGSDGDSVPAPLREAMLLLIAQWYENRQPDCESHPSTPVPAILQQLFAPYKKVRL